jgi:hypothetical protein
MFDPGDIVAIYAPTAGKPKYHLCIIDESADGTAKFFFVNSRKGFEGDFVLKNGDVPCIPANGTGDTAISCSSIVRQTSRQLSLYKAAKIGRLDKKHIRSLIHFLKQNRALAPKDKKVAVEGLGDAL